MKKVEKKAKGGTDAMICDEGEPSRHTTSDYENEATTGGIPYVGGTLTEVNMESIFQYPHQAENYFPSNQQSPVGIEQEASIPYSLLLNAYFRNENNSMQTPFNGDYRRGK
ncbi:NAC domain-containing protein 69 [Sesbania bispinosa]|nr:NAC domain-containing protein 69 [Sesbania bispinosa]